MRPTIACTIVEVLVVVLVVMALTSFLLPSIGGIRQQASRARSMSNARQLHAALQSSVYEHEGRYPCAAQSGRPAEPLVFGQSRVETGQGGAMYFRYQSEYWVSMILPYLSAAAAWEREGVLSEVDLSGRSVHYQKGEVFACEFVMSATAFADPEFFTADGPHLDEMLHQTRLLDVRQPAQKGMLIGSARYGERKPGPVIDALVAFCDGHVAAEPWVNRSFKPRSFVPFLLEYETPIMATEDGLAGVDF
jgi:hypothetical protein